MTEYLFKIRIYDIDKKGGEAWNIEEILCDEFPVRSGTRDGLKAIRILGTQLFNCEGEFVFDIDHGSLLEFVRGVRARIYKAAERYVKIEMEAYPVSDGTVYTGTELEFARMKKDGELDIDLDEMEEFDE